MGLNIFFLRIDDQYWIVDILGIITLHFRSVAIDILCLNVPPARKLNLFTEYFQIPPQPPRACILKKILCMNFVLTADEFK